MEPDVVPPWLTELAQRLVEVPGVVGVVLGGSRARGTADAGSDIDLALLYRASLDTAALRRLAGEVAAGRGGSPPELTEPGAWGPWVDGGGWLTIADMPVDWIYRDLDRVAASIEDALAGRLDFHFQVGHPFGVPGVQYAAEIATSVVLADPSGDLGRMQSRVRELPPALASAWVDRLGEAAFLVDILAKPIARRDTSYVAGVAFRIVTLCAYAVHARAGEWVTNEKGVVGSADRLVPGFARHVDALFAAPDPRPAARRLIECARSPTAR